MTGCSAERRGGSRLATATLRGLGLLAADLGHALAVVPFRALRLGVGSTHSTGGLGYTTDNDHGYTGPRCYEPDGYHLNPC